MRNSFWSVRFWIFVLEERLETETGENSEEVGYRSDFEYFTTRKLDFGRVYTMSLDSAIEAAIWRWFLPAWKGRGKECCHAFMN